MRRLIVVAVAGLLLFAPAVATASPSQGAASTAKLTFSTPDFQWLNNAGGGAYYIWNVGDYWRQDFTATGLASINRVKFNLAFTNVLCCGQTVQVNVTINGVQLAHLKFVEGQASFVTRALSLPAPITGPDYTIQFLETNQVPVGDGSVSLNIDGPSWVVVGSA
jgi:hypothetical protein